MTKKGKGADATAWIPKGTKIVRSPFCKFCEDSNWLARLLDPSFPNRPGADITARSAAALMTVRAIRPNSFVKVVSRRA